VADYSAPSVNTTRRVAHRRPIAVSPFLPQTLQEHSQMLLKAPAVMEVHSVRYEILLLAESDFGAAETAAQLCGRLGAVFSKQWFLGFHMHKAFRLSYSSLLQSQDLLPHNMAWII